jgi:hypothetical protein
LQWQTEADAQAAEERMSALGTQLAKVASLSGTASGSETFEVVYQE